MHKYFPPFSSNGLICLHGIVYMATYCQMSLFIYMELECRNSLSIGLFICMELKYIEFIQIDSICCHGPISLSVCMELELTKIH